MQKYTRFNAQSFQDAMICNMDSIGKYMLEIILHQQRTLQLLKQKKLMQTQGDDSNIVQALIVDSLKVDLVIIQNTCSEKEDNYILKNAYSKISKSKFFSKKDLKGTRIEHGFKRAFMSLYGQDDDTFISTMFLNVDQIQKQLDKDDFQEDGSMAAFWVVENDTDADDADIRHIYDQEPMAENPEDSSDPTTAMNTALALLAKAFKVNTIPTNNNQRSSLIPSNSQIAQPGMNTSQAIKMQMVDDNVGNQYGNGNVETAPTEGNGNGINGNPIRCYNCRGEGHYASNCTVKPRKRDAAYLQQQLQIALEEEAGIQSTQEEFEFMAAADAYEETERVKVNCTSEDTLQQASTSGTQSDNAPVYDSDGSTEVPKDENCYDHDIFNMLTHEVQYTDLQTELDRTKEKLENCIIKKEKEYAVLWNNWYTKCEECKYDKISYDKAYNDMQQKIERLQAQLGDLKGKSSDTQCASNTLDPVSQKLKDENVSLEFQVQNYAKENEHLKTTYKNLFNSIKVTQAQTKSIIDSLQKQLYDTIYENAKLRAQLFDKVSEQKGTTKGTRTNTMFTKQSILGKPPSSSYKPKLYFVTPFPKSSVLPKVDKTNALSKPVTSNSAPATRESKVVQAKLGTCQTSYLIRTNPSKTFRVDNVVPNKPVKTSIRIKPITVSQPNVIHKQQANSDSNGFSSTRVNNTAKTRRAHLSLRVVASRITSIK
ncbi:gag-pol polyprotein [Tanacetum coccineum]